MQRDEAGRGVSKMSRAEKLSGFLSGIFYASTQNDKKKKVEGSVLTGASETKHTLSISTCLQYIPSKLRNIYRKCSHFVATQQPPIQNCSSFTLLCFLLSREWRWRGGTSWKPVKRYEPVCLSFLSTCLWDGYLHMLFCSLLSACQSTSLRAQWILALENHLVNKYCILARAPITQLLGVITS